MFELLITKSQSSKLYIMTSFDIIFMDDKAPNLGSTNTSNVEPCHVRHVSNLRVKCTYHTLFSMYFLEFVVCHYVGLYRVGVGVSVSVQPNF